MRKEKESAGIGNWAENVICTFGEKLFPSFVDIDRNPTNKVVQRTDDAGRQEVSFFVKTLASVALLKVVVADFATSDGGIYGTPDANMNTDPAQ